MPEVKVIIDISPTLSESIGVFPGDQPFTRSVQLSFADGHHLRLSSITSTLHVGAHCDSPGHYHVDGAGIEARDLSYYLGPCQIVDVRRARSPRVRMVDVAMESITEKRVLFRTGSFPDPNRWNHDFYGLCPELIDALAAKGVLTVGLDTPSIDPEDSKDLPAHQAVYRHNMAIIEGLVLDQVLEGAGYFLSAAPLSIAGADAGPTRAVLFRM